MPFYQDVIASLRRQVFFRFSTMWISKIPLIVLIFGRNRFKRSVWTFWWILVLITVQWFAMMWNFWIRNSNYLLPQYHYGRSGPLYMFFRNLSRTRHALADETFETPSIVVTVQCSTSVIERCHVPKSFDNHHEILIQLLTLAVYYASFLIQ